MFVVKHVNCTPHSRQLVFQSMTWMFDPSFYLIDKVLRLHLARRMHREIEGAEK